MTDNNNVAPQPQGGALTPAAFTDWLASEMPANTVIGDPFWWAPKIYAAAIAATPTAPQQAGDGLTGEQRMEKATGQDLSTSSGARAYLSDYFANKIGRHDFKRYIRESLAADFACALSQYLAAPRQPGEMVAGVPDGYVYAKGTDQVDFAQRLGKPAAPAQQDECEALPAVSHTLGGFRGGWMAVHGHPPQDQDIWNAGVRSGMSRAAQQVQADAGAVAIYQVQAQDGNWFDTTERHYAARVSGKFSGAARIVYAHPSPAGERDKRDAERWRAVKPFLRVYTDDFEEREYMPPNIGTVLSVSEDEDLMPGRHETPDAWADEAIDAMSREQSGGGASR